jgi:hypothetical protein
VEANSAFLSVAGSLPIIGALTGLQGNIQPAAYLTCLVVGAGTFIAALRYHSDMGTILSTGVGVVGVSALALGMGPLLALIPEAVGALVQAYPPQCCARLRQSRSTCGECSGP